MTVSALFAKVRTTLQDVTPNRWTNAELENYMNEGIQDIAVSTMYNRIEETLTVVSTVHTYQLDETPIRIDSIDTTQDYTLADNQTLSFTDPTDESIDVVYYAYPTDITLAANPTIALDRDLVEALKFYILKRCYEKEDSTENFGKASYYDREYYKTIANNMTRWHGHTEVNLAKQDYYA